MSQARGDRAWIANACRIKLRNAPQIGEIAALLKKIARESADRKLLCRKPAPSAADSFRACNKRYEQ